MGGRNEFLKKRDERDRKFFEAGMMMGVQLVHDFMEITLHDPATMGKDTFGPARMEKVFRKCSALDDYFHIAFTNHVEADKRQEEMDGLLREIYGKDLIPFSERYPYAKQYGYMKPQKGWAD